MISAPESHHTSLTVAVNLLRQVNALDKCRQKTYWSSFKLYLIASLYEKLQEKKAQEAIEETT